MRHKSGEGEKFEAVESFLGAGVGVRNRRGHSFNGCCFFYYLSKGGGIGSR